MTCWKDEQKKSLRRVRPKIQPQQTQGTIFLEILLDYYVIPSDTEYP